MIKLNIPDKIESAIRLPGKDMKKELLKLLAIKMYDKGILGIGKAAELCEVDKIEFMLYLKQEQVDLNYDIEEFRRDQNNLEFFE